jgi:hypothetical protein
MGQDESESLVHGIVADCGPAPYVQNESADGRVGSSRNDSSGGGTVSHYDFETKDDDKKNSASLSSLGSTLIPVFIYSAVCLLVFLSLRRKLRRVYSPRTLPCLRTPL